MERIHNINQQFGDYQLMHMLSHSDLADVYLGKHVRLQTPVAIKCLQGRFVGDVAEDFQRHYSTLARLRHPHILTILDYGIVDEIAFVVTTYASKGTLRQRHPRNTRVGPFTALNYVQQISEALAYIHDQGLVHRDVKPHNILVNEQEHLLLADFGIMVESHSLHPDDPHLHEFEGTILYAAPEQLQGKPCRRSDQYALAIMAYEWLCGTWPFIGTFHEVAHQHLFVAPPSLAQKGHTCPPNIERVIFKALEKDPRQRFRTIRQFADELEWAFKVAQAKGLLEHAEQAHGDRRGTDDRKGSSLRSLPEHLSGDQSSDALQSPLPPHAPTYSELQEAIHPDAEHSQTVSKPPVQPRRQFKVLFPHRSGSV
jgi:serine/threonine protein kinase